MDRSDFRFFDRLRVRWAEIDAQQIVFNAHYLMYVDTAMTAYWRALAVPYHDAMALLQGDLFVRKATLEYEASARYDERLDVGLRCARIGTSSIVLAAAVFRGAQRLVQGELVYVFADPASQTSRPVPGALRDLLLGFEAGQPVVDVHLGGWPMLGEDARRVRHAVFVLEQRVPADRVFDTDDDSAMHAVARNRLGMPVAAGRLVAHAPGVGRVGWLCALPAVRGGDVGTLLLNALMDAARARGDHEVMLYALAGVAAFYARAGFAPSGTPFVDAGVPHIEMRRAL